MLEGFRDAAPYLLEGAGWTALYTVVGAAAALVVAFLLGLMSLSRQVLVRGTSRVVVEFFRGTSLLVQLLWLAFVLPQLGIRLALPVTAVLAFALNFGAYGAEIVRGAINAVPKAQWEATVALGMGPWQRMRRVVLPQALPEMVPPFGNLWIQILKSSSLLYLIGIADFTQQVNDFRYDVDIMVAYGFALVGYFVLAQVLVQVVRLVENRAAARVGRGPKAVRVTPEAGAAL